MTRYGQMTDSDPKLTSFDLCRDYDHSHTKYYSRRKDQPHDGTKAVTIVATVRYDGKTVNEAAILCRKHASTDKAAVTRGTYHGKNVIIIENADLSSREAVDAQVAAKLAERILAERADKAATAAWVAERKPAHLADRLVRKPNSSLGDLKVGRDETFGTGLVMVGWNKGLTPGEARYLATNLLAMADDAEAVK